MSPKQVIAADETGTLIHALRREGYTIVHPELYRAGESRAHAVELAAFVAGDPDRLPVTATAAADGATSLDRCVAELARRLLGPAHATDGDLTDTGAGPASSGARSRVPR